MSLLDDPGTHGLPELLEPMVIVDWTKFTKNRCLWTGINMVKFHRTEVLVPPFEPEFWDLSFGKGPRLPGSHPYSKYSKNPSKSKSKNTFLSRNGSGKGRRPEILISIDAARSGDLENRGFGQTLPIFSRKIRDFLFFAGFFQITMVPENHGFQCLRTVNSWIPNN